MSKDLGDEPVQTLVQGSGLSGDRTSLIGDTFYDFEEVLALDLLTLSAHTLAAGDVFDAQSHGAKLKPSLEKSQVICIRRAGRLVAYASLWQKSKTLTFISGFNTHPDFRNAGVLRELMGRVQALLVAQGVGQVQSNVYKTNRASMAFHKKLGFEITRENRMGVEFSAPVKTLLAFGFVSGGF